MEVTVPVANTQSWASSPLKKFRATHGPKNLTFPRIIPDLKTRQLGRMTVERMDGGIVTLVGVRPRVQLIDLRHGGRFFRFKQLNVRHLT